MPSPERKRELEQRYHAELVKVGFDDKQAAEIVAEAADRLGIDIPPSDPRTTRSNDDLLEQLRKKGVSPFVSRASAPGRAVQVIMRKEHNYGQRRHTTWNRIKSVRTLADIVPGMNAMDAMKTLLAEDMKALEFTQEDVEFILGKTNA